MRDRRVFIVAGLSALLAVAVYWNSLSNGLVHDDVSAIEQNDAIRNPLDWRRIVLQSSWVESGRPTSSYRPLTTWSFAVNYAAHGTSPFGYHLGNVLGHAAATAELVVLAAATGLSPAAAGVAGSLFAVHPIHTEVVANGVGRAEILAAAFALLALLLGRRTAEAGWRLSTAVAATSAYGLALLAKEHVVAMVVLMPLADLLLTDGGSVRRFAAGLLGRRGVFYAALIAVTGGYLLLRAAALGDVVAVAGGGLEAITFWANPAAGSPQPVRILTALQVLAKAIGLLVWPHDLSADYSYRQIPVVDSIRAPGAIVGLVVTVGLAVVALVLWRRRPVACFWLLFALGFYGVVSNILFPIGTIFAERLLYLPSAGFCVLAALAVSLPRGTVVRAIAGVAVVVTLADWSAVTISRNPAWRDAMSLGLDMVRTAPDSVHAHHFLGATYQGEGRDEKALAELGRALEIYPEHLSSLYDVGLIHQRHGDAESALAVYRRILDIDARYFPAWISTSAIDCGRGSYPSALEAAEHALAIVPELPAAHLVRANALRGLVRHAEARDEYAAALHGDPKMPEALIGLAFSALDLEDFSLAADAFRRLIDVVPSVDAYSGLVYSARRAGRAAEAEQALAAARLRYPNDPAFAPAKDAP